MGVTFTPNIALAMPDEAELAKDWTITPARAAANNAIIEDKTDINLTAFGATIIGKTSDPNVGSGGGISFDYQEFQGFVWGNFVVKFGGSGIAAGSGEYGIKLPFVADGTFHLIGNALDYIPGFNSAVGEGYAFDASAVNTSGLCAVDIVTVGGISYARLVIPAYTGKTTRVLGSAGPFTVATGDRLEGNFFYKHV